MRWILGLPVLVLLILFALSNAAPVRIGLWPVDISVELPLSLAILGAMGIAFFLGGLTVWLQALRAHRRANAAEARVRALGAELELLRARLAEAAPASLPPPG